MSFTSIAHCRGLYLREFAFKTVPGLDMPYLDGHLPDLKRIRKHPIQNDQDMERFTKKYSSRPGEYVTVYSFEKLNNEGKIDYSTAKINRVYLDFDDEDSPQAAISEAIIVLKTLIRNNIFPYLYFSGKKGIALYIDFITVDVKTENKKQVLCKVFDSIIEATEDRYENFFGMWVESTHSGDWGLQTIDLSVRGDLARVSRIPNTRHKSGLYCIPLKYGDLYRGIDYIRGLAKQPRTDINLESTIAYCMARNETMPTIIKTLETEVINERAAEEARVLREQRKREYLKSRHTPEPGQITEDDKQRAHNTPLSLVIGSAVRMKCPLHHGDNPTSFYIDHNKNYWYCHSCGKHGDAITYIMETQHLDFRTAVRQLVTA